MSSQLTEALKSMIRAEGAIPLARYMQLSLMDPKEGYYAANDPLGRQGDFITAPEISQMFGEMIGIWLASVWMAHGKPSSFALLELGPGRGTMMLDALRATAHVTGFHEALQLFFYEKNKSLQQAQAQNLADFNPHHIQDWDELPAMPLYMVANEFFDAMPIHQYKLTPHGWREIMVTEENDAFAFVEGTGPIDLPMSNCSPYFEVSPHAIAHMDHLCQHIAAHGGAGLVIDYGYGEPTGRLSLQAIKDHTHVDPLSDPGLVDLSADVDFSALSLVAKRAGLHPMRLMEQGLFLRNMGIEIRVQKLKASVSQEDAHQIDQDFFRLTDPSEMGTLFKVLAVSAVQDDNMPGFE
ncbi:MAG: class I SAM-dependent methyltransferase [Bdellovibrionales bacterium]